ncbi:MAG: BMP family ABC transporter substrate-binding protein [Firmicutes bacterium]|nr:BMP family ABC transporter substrate-binding protein [Bacillota bacterium]
MSKTAAALSSVIALTTLLAGCSTTPSAAPVAPKAVPQNAAAMHTSHAKIKVGLVTDTGGLNDHSFNHLAFVGLQMAEKKWGVTGSVVQSASAAAYVPNLTAYASQGYNLVIAVGYLMQDAVQKVAKQYPHTKFLIIDDQVPGSNIDSAIFETQQCGYLVGLMAGLMNTQKHVHGINGRNTVGVIGGTQIPPVESYIAGFIAGVHHVDPKAKVLLNWANSYSDPASGTELANQQISDGADIVFPVAGGTGNGVISAAAQKGVYAIGVDANQNYLAPKTVMTSALKAVDVATETVIGTVVSGHFKGGTTYFDLKNHGVGYAPVIKAVPASIVKEVNSYIPKIESGKIKIPALLTQSTH